MHQKKKSRAPLILIVPVMLSVAIALWVGMAVNPKPSIAVRTGFDPQGGQLALLGPSNPIAVTASEDSRGVGHVTVEFVQGGASIVLAEADHPTRGWNPLATVPRPEETLELVVDRDTFPQLAEGPAIVRVTASRSGGFLRRPEPVVQERAFTVRLVAPSVSVRSSAHYVAQGGCEVVVFHVGENAARSGVQAGDWFFPGYPLPGGGERDRFALFAVPYDVGDRNLVWLVVEDEVGNRNERRFLDQFFARPLGTAIIRVDDAFLERAVPDIVARTAQLRDEGSLIDQYLKINGELRVQNRAELRDLAARTREEFLWRGDFSGLRNAAATAAFAQRRTYVYNGEKIDTQDHLGFDLASTAHAPVRAANDGVVVKTGWFGIYGDAVVIDHGYGLQSLYGHLSSVDVAEGDVVSSSQEIGRTGITGLAGGDHLHFAVLLQGLPVSPIEWWDDHWIHDRLRLKLGDALPG